VAVVDVIDFLRGAVGIDRVITRLADEFEAVDVAVVQLAVAGTAAAERLVDDLRVAGGVQRVDQIGRGDACNRFVNATAVAAVPDLRNHPPSIFTFQVVKCVFSLRSTSHF
jgi:hypothetical protein